jgi:hypothetical protein
VTDRQRISAWASGTGSGRSFRMGGRPLNRAAIR